MPKFITKPVIVQAIKFTGDNLDEIRKEFGDSPGIDTFIYSDESYCLMLTTADDIEVPCTVGMWVMKDSKPHRFYPCNNDHFQMKYEVAEGNLNDALDGN